MFKPKLLFQFQCLRLKAKVARKAFDVSFPVVLVTTLVNIEKKLRKTTFCKSLCLPSKVQKIFFLVYFCVFRPEKCMYDVFDKAQDVRWIDTDIFMYGVYST